MLENNIIISFLSEFSEKILSCPDAYSLDSICNNISKILPFVENLDIFIHDENTQKLKYFTKSWVTISNEEQKYLYEKFCLLDETSYADSNKYYLLNNSDDRIETNELFFCISKNGNKIGLLRLAIKDFIPEYIKFFITIKNLIALCIINLTITSKMEGSINFYNAMKNIAKIIESQYEPSYVIPLIGEMIDRFVEQHLIYVFIKQDDGYKLAWPNACKQTEIIKALDDLSVDNPYFIMNDMQTGVFALINENTIIGAIVAYSNIEKLSASQVDYIYQLAKQSATTLQRAYVYAEILEHATLDALTGLNNRRQFETRLSQEVATAKRKKTELCCIMIDVDHFKSVNDTYGHLAGDCVLKNVAQIIKNELREYDTAARYGGEEFIIILPFTAMVEAMFVAQRLRKTIEESKIDITEAHVKNTEYINITISAGVSSYDPNEDSPQSFYQKADAALYDAKNAGRNKVIVYK